MENALLTQQSVIPGTILLVEDEPADALLLKRAFTRAGVQNPIQHVNRGDTGLAYLEGINEYADRERFPLPILIILDLKLPGMSGLELLRWIRLQRELRRIPVLVLTSETDDDFIQSAYDAGANSYLLKKFDEAEIDRAVGLISGYWLKLNESPLIVNRGR